MTDKETAYGKISELVIRFKEQYASYKKADYNETLTRRDFIDPFFKALGWDVDNKNGYAESYREVIHEDKVKVGKATKAPDYSFRLPGGKRLFFVEAKKPYISVKEEIQPAYQVRRYGWSAKLPISIITDFEEFSVYDCTKKPKPTDKASVARIKYLSYEEYLTEFEFLWDTFSKERVLKGSFDKYVQSDTNKKGTATVDKEFLQSLDNWRTYLATSISWNNKVLDEDEINFVVQQTIDRIIFLRIAEDRGVEPENNIAQCIKSGNYYSNLYNLFLTADEKYNSGLFDLKKDTVSKNIVIDNKVIKNIIEELYYPKCEYAFDVLPVEILGTAYEQFLGKVIRITSSHHSKIEEKPEVRKAGGVYYTPQYVVDYIVQNTVGKLVEGKTPKEVCYIKILDPACGSGSFLLGAYQYLLDWHKKYYNNLKGNTTSKGRKEDVLRPDGNLTTTEKKRILLNNIYGVDIDVNAVEVSKLSLLLKCMEGETEASINQQLRLFNDRVLPTLDNNIKCGNSLVGTDFYDNQLSLDEDKRIKPFNWQKAFPLVFLKKNDNIKKQELLSLAKKAKYHATKAMEYAQEIETNIDSINENDIIYSNYVGFDVIIGNPPYVQLSNIDNASHSYLLTHFSANSDLYSIFIERCLSLVKDNSNIGFIVPSLFLKGVRYESLRAIINTQCYNFEFKELGDGVFENVKMPTCIILLKKGKPSLQQNFFYNKNLNLFNKVSTIKLGEIAEIHRGLEIGKNKLLDNEEKECITGSSLNRYAITKIKYISRKTHNDFLKNEAYFLSPKIIVRETGNKFYATIDYKNLLTTRSIYNAKIRKLNFSYDYILGILNSKFLEFYFKQFISPNTKLFPKIRIVQLQEIPIPDNSEKQKVIELEKIVQQILLLYSEKQQTTLRSTSEQIQSKIDYCEDRINEIVYQIYGLTANEIKIVEGDTE
ncbi:MAG: Type IIS restriction enzyme Eco57I [Bacteroidetes bacterium ADurb.Bin408]|nr:MAG: Type IIS restriction enzyme Eco57I [Bacteroidetes bacterium ADurb.Bin408]